MKVFSLLAMIVMMFVSSGRHINLLILFICQNLVEHTEARYVTRASRDLVRHIRRRMERTYGAGLINLYHPVTKAFNHKIVIE